VSQSVFQHEVQAPRRWNRFATSVVLHIIGAVLFLRIAAIVPTHVITATQLVPITWVPTEEPKPAPKIVPPSPDILAQLRKPQPLPDLQKIEPKLQPPKIEAPKIESPKPKLPEPAPEVAKVEPPKFDLPEADVSKATPPKREVQPVTGFEAAEVKEESPGRKREVASADFGAGSSAPATVNKPAREVQTGGFGDPNGVPGHSDGKAHLQIASVGSFDLPNGGGGVGNGTGGAHGIRGTVADSGFGNGVAAGGHGDAGGGKRTIASAGFSDAATATPSAPKAREPLKAALTPVEILEKPKPAYTDEARKLHVEGDVVLELRFTASGDIQIVRIVRGLGHGLDENAQQAAARIKFRPASRDGQPQDSIAMVHIVFQLAN
jgi:TonB family protein